jgi:ribosomal protein S18 acetylase RimI-like enzyme
MLGAMEVLIRPASEQDDAALRAIDTATWSSDVSPAPPPPPDKSFFGPDNPPENVLVAVIDGVVAGYIKVVPASSLESHRHVHEVRGLAVDPAFRRRGVARRLMDAAADEAVKRGARALKLRVLAPNTSARALYESCGFKIEGVLRQEFWLDGRYVDDVIMALDLSSALAPRP